MDILFLLLGGNPLPNYVTAAYLLNKDRNDKCVMPVPHKIFIVSTTESKQFYCTIFKQLQPKESEDTCQYKEIKLCDEQRDPEKIQEKIKKELEKEKNINSIHLNYSGGTKPMSINALIAIREFSNSRSNIKLILSDLDPDDSRFKLFTLTDNIQVESFPQKDDLRKDVKLNIEDLLKLHNIDEIKYTKSAEDKILKENLIDIESFSLEMSQKYSTGTRSKDMFDHCEKLKKNNGQGSEDIITAHPSLSNMFDENLNMKISTRQFYGFINGKWLEYYTLKSLKDFAEKNPERLDLIERDIGASCNKRPMQIDVIAMKGYQLFLFTCTVSQRIKIVKKKAFEALYRAEQLGGEHARVIIVSTMFNKPKNTEFFSTANNNFDALENDLKQFDAKRKCDFIGLDELLCKEKMTKKLHDIIK